MKNIFEKIANCKFIAHCAATKFDLTSRSKFRCVTKIRFSSPARPIHPTGSAAPLLHSYGMSFGLGLGMLNGKTFRIGHLGSLAVPMMLSGLTTIEMALVDLGCKLKLGTGFAAAQDHYRNNQIAIAKHLAA